MEATSDGLSKFGRLAQNLLRLPVADNYGMLGSRCLLHASVAHEVGDSQSDAAGPGSAAVKMGRQDRWGVCSDYAHAKKREAERTRGPTT